MSILGIALIIFFVVGLVVIITGARKEADKLAKRAKKK